MRTKASSSRATLAPEMLVSAIRARFSRQQSSLTARASHCAPLVQEQWRANFRQAPKVSDRKSSDPAARQAIARNRREGALVRAQRHRHWRATAACPLAATPTTDGQALFPVDAEELLFIHHHTHTLQHDANAPPLGDCCAITCRATDTQTVAASRQSCSFPGGYPGYRADAPAARSWGRHPLPGSTCFACARGDQDAGPTLRDRMTAHRPQHRVPPLHRRRQGFPSRSFSTTLAIGLEPMAPQWLDPA